jgi:hypothetical protein
MYPFPGVCLNYKLMSYPIATLTLGPRSLVQALVSSKEVFALQLLIGRMDAYALVISGVVESCTGRK